MNIRVELGRDFRGRLSVPKRTSIFLAEIVDQEYVHTCNKKYYYMVLLKNRTAYLAYLDKHGYRPANDSSHKDI